jgi:hypothetical protein
VIEQSTVLKESPEGSAGLTVQPVIAPPVLLGIQLEIAAFTVATRDVGL